MADYSKHGEGRNTLFLIPIKEDGGKTIYLDFTRIAKPALKDDLGNNHETEKGPCFGMVVYRAIEYVEYLQDCKLTIYNFQCFNTTKGYSLFVEDA